MAPERWRRQHRASWQSQRRPRHTVIHICTSGSMAWLSSITRTASDRHLNRSPDAGITIGQPCQHMVHRRRRDRRRWSRRPWCRPRTSRISVTMQKTVDEIDGGDRQGTPSASVAMLIVLKTPLWSRRGLTAIPGLGRRAPITQGRCFGRRSFNGRPKPRSDALLPDPIDDVLHLCLALGWRMALGSLG
jgi:hypothetical protein